MSVQNSLSEGQIWQTRKGGRVLIKEVQATRVIGQPFNSRFEYVWRLDGTSEDPSYDLITQEPPASPVLLKAREFLADLHGTSAYLTGRYDNSNEVKTFLAARTYALEEVLSALIVAAGEEATREYQYTYESQEVVRKLIEGV